MRILLITAYFPPDTGSASHLFYELGKELRKKGHHVTVITGMPGYHALGNLDKYRMRFSVKETLNEMFVKRVFGIKLPRRLMFGRALWQFSSALTFLVAAMSLPRHDIAIVYSPPLPLGLAAWGIRVLRGTPFILNVQDLFPQSIIDLGLLKNETVIRLFEWMEKFVYKKSDRITVHSRGNREHIITKGATPQNVTVIPNWVDTDFIQPGNRMNGFRQRHGLGDDFIVSFAGILGFSQDIDVIIEAARLIRDGTGYNVAPRIKWLIVGDGVEKARLESKAQNFGLDNVLFLPMQPREKYPETLHASDVCLVTLCKKVKTPVVPSKILSIMAAGRPVVAALNPSGDAAGLIADAGCGICVPPETPEALAEAVLKLYSDEGLRNEMGVKGRLFAEENLSLKKCASLYEDLVISLLDRKA